MTFPVLTALSMGNCPHGAPATFISGASKVLFDIGPPLLLGDSGMVSGCPFTLPNGKPQPCVKALVVQASSKVLVENKPVIMQSPGDICQSAEQIPQGPVGYTLVQSKVLVL